MLFAVLALLSVPFVPQVQPASAPQSGTGAARPGVVERFDDHGHRALAFVDVLGAPDPVLAGGPQALTASDWMALGPFGGDVADVGASPTNASIAIAGIAPSSGSGTVFRSIDGGASWTEVAALTGQSTYDVEFDSLGRCYIGTIDGVWRSADDGATWTNLPLGIGLNDQVFEITIDPTNDANLWVGVADALGNQTQTLLHSIDSGATWTNRAPAGGPYTFTGIELDVGTPGKVFAAWSGAFGGGGVFVSGDNGLSWANRSAGLPGNPMEDLVFDGTTLYLCGGQLFGSQDVGVWSTTNDGMTWTQLSNAGWPLLAITDLELDPAAPGRILCTSLGAGLFESLDSGATWSFGVGVTSILSGRSVQISPTSASTLFLGTDSNAVWRSTNGGAAFAPSSIGIGQLDVYSVATNPANPAEIAIAFQGLNNGGVQTSNDGGLTWGNEPVPGTRWNTVGFDPSGTLYALSDGPTTIAPEALYRRSGGGNWSSIGPDQGTAFESELVALAFDPQDPSVILLGGGDFGVAGFEPTVWRSPDLGASWTKVYEGPNDNEDVTAITHSTAGSGVWVASFTDFGGNPQTGGALRSSDNAASWVESGSGLSAETQGFDLSLDPDGSAVFLADGDTGAGNGGLFRSGDGGQSWTQVDGGGEGSTRGVVQNPNNAAEVVTLHIVTPKVRASLLGGGFPAPYDTGLDPSAFLRDLHVAAGGGAFYVASNQGVWRTNNGLGTTYCTTSPNSVGVGALISAGGSTSFAANNLVFETTGVPPNKPGIYYYGPATSNAPFGNGVRCVGGVVFRLPTTFSTAGGVTTWAYDNLAPPNPNGQVTPGSTWYFQLWYRDPVDPPAGFNLSNGLQIDFLP